ncbi:hypothetical protein CLOM_g16052 [Closterium sp. NIES-68]|nr:hypothetical protein CLOM_g16052 [Closterium sp. NIES-68]GJP72029.1 hypothetical protein CLOP_g2801 [Closterium sp. NIES-67]
MVEGPRREAGEQRRELDDSTSGDDGQSLLGRPGSDAVTCGCIPSIGGGGAARDVARDADLDSARGGARDGGSAEMSDSDPPTRGRFEAAPDDSETLRTSAPSRQASAALPTARAVSSSAQSQPLSDARNDPTNDGCSIVGVEAATSPRDEGVSPSKSVAKLPRTSVAELSSTVYCYISHHAFVQQLLCTCCSHHSGHCAASRCDCNGRECSGSSSAGHPGSGGSSSGGAEWTEVATDRLSIVAHLTAFSIIGIAIQYGMDLLFGPEVAHVTSDEQAVFIDLPANMLGCFLLGMCGVVFLPSLLAHSRHLAIGLMVGLCGSISTFATWNQRMVAIATAGLWVRALFGYFAGSVLPIISLVVGADTAHNIRALRTRFSPNSSHAPPLLPTTSSTTTALQPSPSNPASPSPSPALPLSSPASTRRHLMPVLLCAMFLWAAAITGALLASNNVSLQTFALACALAPLGTCLRWWLLRFNGAGLGLRASGVLGRVKGSSGAGRGRGGGGKGEGGAVAWLPWGTLAANVGASAVEAAISVVYLAVKSHTSQVMVGGVQLGFLTGLSTVSMFSLEILYFHFTLGTPWRSYVYLLVTVLPSFVIGLLVYSVPVWVMGWDSLYNHV